MLLKIDTSCQSIEYIYENYMQDDELCSFHFIFMLRVNDYDNVLMDYTENSLYGDERVEKISV